MRRGDFEAAWRISDAHLFERLRRGEPKHEGPRHLQHIWQGEPLAGKRVLVRCYHGLGDTVQFIRFVAPLRRIATHVAVWAQPQLLPLVATAEGVDAVLPLHDGTPEADYDVDIEIMELAHALRADARVICCPVPYLHVPDAPAPPNSDRRRIGLVWKAGDWDTRRSIPTDTLRPLAHLPCTDLLSLQCGAAAGEAARIPATDVGSDDVTVFARRLHSLDLLITVDTFAAHLAGALGLPVWLLLHTDCDWRWGEAEHSLWYPTMRLFRQTQPGDWQSAIAQVDHELRNPNAPPATKRNKQLLRTFGR